MYLAERISAEYVPTLYAYTDALAISQYVKD